MALRIWSSVTSCRCTSGLPQRHRRRRGLLAQCAPARQRAATARWWGPAIRPVNCIERLWEVAERGNVGRDQLVGKIRVTDIPHQSRFTSTVIPTSPLRRPTPTSSRSRRMNHSAPGRRPAGRRPVGPRRQSREGALSPAGRQERARAIRCLPGARRRIPAEAPAPAPRTAIRVCASAMDPAAVGPERLSQQRAPAAEDEASVGGSPLVPAPAYARASRRPRRRREPAALGGGSEVASPPSRRRPRPGRAVPGGRSPRRCRHSPARARAARRGRAGAERRVRPVGAVGRRRLDADAVALLHPELEARPTCGRRAGDGRPRVAASSRT